MYIAIISKSIMSTTSLERFRAGNRIDPLVNRNRTSGMVCHIYNGQEENIELPEPPQKSQTKSIQQNVILQELKDQVAKDKPRNKKGNLTFPVPMTGVTVAVSKKDIITSASLSAQLLVMILTLSMTVKALKISGQKVPFDDWFSSWMHLLVAHTMITLVDPMVCVICSSEYRKALYEILSRAERGKGNNIDPVTRRP